MTHHDLDIFARTLYGEARGEYTSYGLAAFIAVGNVITNRLKLGRYGNTIAVVCLKPRQFSCWNVNDPNRVLIQDISINQEPLFKCCKKVAQSLAMGKWPDLTRGSDHYHSLSCSPSWARKSKIKLRLGNHIFYKLHERGKI